MKSPEELRRHIQQTEQSLASVQQQLEKSVEELRPTRQELGEHKQKLAEAQALIADLKQQLFGAKAEKLSAEQEEQLKKLAGGLQAQAQPPPPLSQEVLEQALKQERGEPQTRSKEKKGVATRRRSNWKSGPRFWNRWIRSVPTPAKRDRGSARRSPPSMNLSRRS